MRIYTWILLLLLPFGFTYTQGVTVHGTVFADNNNNRRQDPGEPGLPNVVISDQMGTALTDEQGNFTLESDTDLPYVFITQPTGYTGKYYYPKAGRVNFPLRETQDQTRFTFIHASDTHIDSLNLPRMAHFREMADSIGADFVIVTGDLVRDALRVDVATASNYYEMYVQEIEKFSMPVYSGVGNHELFGIERDKSLVSMEHPFYGKKMYRHYLGPNYYSFNYGDIHFISIDGVDYQNLYYFGGVDSLQLEWLENDLKHLPSDMPVVTFNHIPFASPGFSFMDFEQHIFYGPQLLKQGDQLYHRHIVYNFEDVLARIGERPYPLALSGHYHARQEGHFGDGRTIFAQTSAITRPDQFTYNGFPVRSGFTVYEVEAGQIISRIFMALNVP